MSTIMNEKENERSFTSISDVTKVDNYQHKQESDTAPVKSVNKDVKYKSTLAHLTTYLCDQCCYQTCRKKLFNGHKLLHKGQFDFTCNECDFKTTHYSHLKMHKRSHAGQKIFTCSMCTFSCTSIGPIKQHMYVHTGIKPFSCDVCNYSTVSVANLKKHKISHNPERPFACKQCNYTTKSEYYLKTHKLTHTDAKLFACDKCPKRFKRLSELRNHLKKHLLNYDIEKSDQIESVIQCEKCNYSAASGQALSIHMRTHTGEKSYSCDQCSFAASHLSILKTHKIIHSGDKPYHCDQCEYTSSKSSCLKLHKFKHTHEKPHPCSMRNFKSSDKNAIKGHMRTYTGDKPYACNKCKYSCSRTGMMKKHKEVHHNKKPLLTDNFNYRCMCLTSMKLHIKTHISENQSIKDTKNKLRIQKIKNYTCNQLMRRNFEKNDSCDEQGFSDAVSTDSIPDNTFVPCNVEENSFQNEQISNMKNCNGKQECEDINCKPFQFVGVVSREKKEAIVENLKDCKKNVENVKEEKIMVKNAIEVEIGLRNKDLKPGGSLPPLCFHTVHGDYVRLSRDHRVARRIQSFFKGTAFSARPVAINEKVCITFTDLSSTSRGALRFGFTSHDPTLLTGTLPDCIVPELTNRAGHWAKPLPERLCKQGALLQYYVIHSGDVHFSVDGKDEGVIFQGVDTKVPLWALLDIYGNCTGIQFVDSRTQLNNATRRLEDSNSVDNSTSVSNVSLSERNSANSLIEEEIERNLIPTLRAASINDAWRPVTFHSTCGRNLKLGPEPGVASLSQNEFRQGYAFTACPLAPNERLLIRILETDKSYGSSLAFGLTSCDPARLTQRDLPDKLDMLLDRPEYWVVTNNLVVSLEVGEELVFSVSSTGEIEMALNGGTPVILMQADNTLRLWAFLDVCGSTRSVCVLSKVTPRSDSAATFRQPSILANHLPAGCSPCSDSVASSGDSAGLSTAPVTSGRVLQPS